MAAKGGYPLGYYAFDKGEKGSVGKNSKISRRLKCVGAHPDVGNDENTVFVTKGQHPVAVAVSL